MNLQKYEEMIHVPTNSLVHFSGFYLSHYVEVLSQYKLNTYGLHFQIDDEICLKHNFDKKYIGFFTYLSPSSNYRFLREVEFICADCQKVFSGYTYPFKVDFCYGCDFKLAIKKGKH